jgi:spectinomycin phosphotransferase
MTDLAGFKNLPGLGSLTPYPTLPWIGPALLLMLEKPDLPDPLIIACVQGEYALPATRLSFLPLGADVHTAVYSLETQDGTPYFLKLRTGVFDETSVRLPKFLHSQGLQAVIPPLETRLGELTARLGDYRLVLYPFIEGAVPTVLSDRHWLEFALALKRLHSLPPPPELANLLQRERFSPHGRDRVKAFQRQVEREEFAEPVAASLAALMRAKRCEISHIVQRAEELARSLKNRRLEFVLCHSDVHVWNLLVSAGGDLFIVDWDNPILAPKERDLMFIGGGVSPAQTSPVGEALFYRAYGPTQVDQPALAYYRYERIVQDISEYCQQLLSSESGGDDREQSYGYFASNFLPGNTLEVALQTDRF